MRKAPPKRLRRFPLEGAPAAARRSRLRAAWPGGTQCIVESMT